MNSIALQIQKFLKAKQPFVFYKKKDDKKVNLLLQKNTELYTTLSYDRPGFVMAKFDLSKEAVLFPLEKTEQFNIALMAQPLKNIPHNYPTDNKGKSDYIQLVKKTKRFIASSEANKVVVSKVIDKEYDSEKIGAVYETMLHAYPMAMVYFWHHPKVGIWLGATPEKLINLKEENFYTMALAGTQLYGKNITWEKKEKKEQQWVGDFILKALKPLSEEIHISDPYTLKTYHLAHICTDIKGKLKANIRLQKLLANLHPTPAVCGTPRDNAKKFILANENYDRTFYTGFLGELLIEEQTDLYVNLRCMQLTNTLAKIYVGGGIIKDSVPENEWEEIQNKAKIMGSFIA